MSALSWVLGFLADLANHWLATKRAEQAMRDLGAATARNEARAEAERQEAVARQAGEAAADGPDDPRDLRSDP